jgi:hypothetical protein
MLICINELCCVNADVAVCGDSHSTATRQTSAAGAYVTFYYFHLGTLVSFPNFVFSLVALLFRASLVTWDRQQVARDRGHEATGQKLALGGSRRTRLVDLRYVGR